MAQDIFPVKHVSFLGYLGIQGLGGTRKQDISHPISLNNVCYCKNIIIIPVHILVFFSQLSLSSFMDASTSKRMWDAKEAGALLPKYNIQ